MEKHLLPRELALQSRNCCKLVAVSMRQLLLLMLVTYHKRSRAEIRSSKDDHA